MATPVRNKHLKNVFLKNVSFPFFDFALDFSSETSGFEQVLATQRFDKQPLCETILVNIHTIVVVFVIVVVLKLVGYSWLLMAF